MLEKSKEIIPSANPMFTKSLLRFGLGMHVTRSKQFIYLSNMQKTIFTFVLAILMCVTEGNSQALNFSNFKEKVVTPSRAAFDKASTDKERDSILFVPHKALKNLVGAPMPEFTAQTLDGKLISKESLAGKIVVMNFWFIGCKPCVAELPALNRLVEEYEGKEVVFLAFGNSTRKRTVEEFLPKHEFKYQLITDSEAYADLFLATELGFPTSMVFDHNGILQHISSGGFVDDRAKTAVFNEYSPVINRLLIQKKAE